MNYTVNALSPTLGGEVIGLDLSKQLNTEIINDIQSLFNKYQVLVFRDQNLADEDQIRFSETFGELEKHPMAYNTSKHPEITVISNVFEDGKPLGFSGPPFDLWHSDMCYLPKIARVTFLYAIKVPSEHGETSFANMYKAYEELSSDIKTAVEGKNAIFGSGHNLMKRCKDRGYDLPIPESDIKPDVEHPVIINHPVTNKKSIFVNWTHTDLIKGIPQEKSDSLLNCIYEHCKRPEFIYSHHYKQGDLIVWDNFSTLHTGPTGVAEEARIMRRTVVKGSKPAFSG